MIRRHRLAALALAVLAAASLSACGGGGGAPAPTCSDGARNGAETGLDCGGPTCTPCPAGQGCASARDCQSDVCAPGGACAVPTCNDAVRNGRETGLDCGGDCAPCADGLACQVDGDCTSGRCQAQVCLKGLGTACGGAAECASGACADGLCCEVACDGACEACNLPGRFGHCDPVPAGADPADECATDDPTTCGQDGACSGERSCRLHPTGTSCAPAVCATTTVEQPAGSCDGLGACVAPAPVACSPLTCDSAARACRIRCADATECDAGYGCSPEGGCLKVEGRACGADGECLSGFCTDGVCCGSRCLGTCEACDLPGRAGTCDPVPAGTDPASECAETAASTCGTTGACSGTRSCALWAGGTTCAAAACAGETGSYLARACDGVGLCSPATFLECAPLRCDAATRACKTTCTADADCATGYACAGGACKRALGQACAGDAECGSGFCTDGVCCQARCGGACERCDLAGRAGLCDPVPGGTDPDAECSDQGARSCGTTGACSGARACALYTAGTTCAAASCANATTAAPADTCDGLGACRDGGTVACTPYTCSPSTLACRTTCASDTDCATGFACSGGACRKALGQACSAGTECASGSCADGSCCSTACTGICQACGLPGSVGTCAAIPAGTDPANECPADGCHFGACDGAGACQVAPAGTSCGAGLACDAAGSCLDVNECANPAACDPDATCTNTVGGFTCACNAGWIGSGATCQRPASCAQLQQARPGSPSGLYVIDPDGAGGLAEFTVSCDMVTSGGGWTVFQRRQDATDFDRTFAEYQAGFGSPAGSHWLGLDRLVALTAAARTLRVEVAAPGLTAANETYTTFSVGAGPGYVLTATGASGSAGDGLAYHNGMAFSAKDLDQDAYGPGSCAQLLRAGGWFNACHTTNINGPFLLGPLAGGDLISWWPYRSLTLGLSFAEMKLR